MRHYTGKSKFRLKTASDGIFDGVLFFGFEAEQVLCGGKPRAEYAQRDDEAEHQPEFADVEETPADVQAVGFEDGIDQGVHGREQPTAKP
ncbi:hypothetical protein ESCNG_670008 [Neisseria gonorrhoeae]|nr:hypothetical protein ESCNG_670008 [Neisseria gonorrhoeae]